MGAVGGEQAAADCRLTVKGFAGGASENTDATVVHDSAERSSVFRLSAFQREMGTAPFLPQVGLERMDRPCRSFSPLTGAPIRRGSRVVRLDGMVD